MVESSMHFEQASGVITLTTDFGLSDPFVGVMKGAILCRYPEAKIVDLTHDILVHWPAEAGFWLQRSFEYFPRGTVHVAVVDPGVGTARELLAVQIKGHLMLAPDNGLLANIVEANSGAIVLRIAPTVLAALALGRVSATFHGRDIFAPLAAELAAGRLQPGTLGPVTDDIVPSWLEPVHVERNALSGVVATVDHFGNLLTNIEGQQLAGFVEPHVYAGNQVLPLRRTYGDAKPGEYLALINSFGVLELACAEGHAAERMGLSRGAPVVVRDAVRHR
jgi:S-adenosyl-L-methionine hydrolase (adenosine-forming)